MKIFALTLLLFSLLNPSLQAREIAGVNLTETINLQNTPLQDIAKMRRFTLPDETLQLNGAGIRSKFIFDIYVGALYLTGKATTPEQVYAMPGSKRVRMHMLYDEVSKEKLINGWTEGLEKNLSEKEFNQFKRILRAFNSFFTTVKKGDVIDIHFVPEMGTTVSINNNPRGTVENDAFFTALLKVWLGKEPADEDLKQGMLGKTAE